MAGIGRKIWTAGEVATAFNIQNYLQDQVVQVYGSTANRGSAVGTPTDGMVSFLTSNNSLEVYFDDSWYKVRGSRVGSYAATGGTSTVPTSLVNNSMLLYGTAGATVVVPDIFAIGDRVDVVRDSAGVVNIVAGTGVFEWAGAGTAGTAVVFKIDQQYNAATVLKVANNSYRVIGRVTV